MLRYLLPLFILTIVSLTVLLYSFRFLSPTNPDSSLIIINLAYFFLSAWVFIAAITSLVLYSLGSFRTKGKVRPEVEAVHKPKIIFRRSLRHGCLLATILIGIGLLNAIGFGNPLNIILLISTGVLIEIYFFGH